MDSKEDDGDLVTVHVNQSQQILRPVLNLSNNNLLDGKKLRYNDFELVQR